MYVYCYDDDRISKFMIPAPGTVCTTSRFKVDPGAHFLLKNQEVRREINFLKF